ncbi:dephospho-CoA kinase [Calycomorphotria hydatis]|uniref:Dephospho-CoA kinase n=1 Tax=Calycomorphotria hydatis TaxID=2528027 RepID=A0A517TD29_9PLAN|nr:dephospho-CoA kinase [Calycomorphotria hydatis]QDT66283.1 Dephospho-CoA kinase [Calycomorphotria hydatis]
MPDTDQPFVIGIVGGVAAGKSTVARRLAEKHHLPWIDADQIGHQVLTMDVTKNAIRKRFGDDVFDSDGQIDRTSLGRAVFGPSANPQDRLDLEAITHPHIRQEITRQITDYRNSPNRPRAVLLDAAVMLETGWSHVCDAVLFLEVSDEIRRDRAVNNRGWKPEKWAQREAHQWEIDRKRAAADFIVNNDGSLPETINNIEQQLGWSKN